MMGFANLPPQGRADWPRAREGAAPRLPLSEASTPLPLPPNSNGLQSMQQPEPPCRRVSVVRHVLALALASRSPRHVAIAAVRVRIGVVVLALALALWLALPLALPSRHICPLLDDLQLPAAEEGSIQQQGVLHALLVRKFDVRKALWGSGVLVHEDRDAVDLPATLEVLLELFWGGAVVDVPDVHRPLVNLLPVDGLGRFLHGVSQLLQLLGLLLHLLDLLLHFLDLCIGSAQLKCRVVRHGGGVPVRRLAPFAGLGGRSWPASWPRGA
mmetsp:Transcript_52097/g.137634  ORF Transcript_52097/g.137634 Transcript_52097/m.137634 type:complete len:270 (+) Transcript_52097:164-973(+)